MKAQSPSRVKSGHSRQSGVEVAEYNHPRAYAAMKRAFRCQVLERRARRELTCAQKDVLMKLATFLGKDGLWPSHETIAKAADVSVRTVIRALERAYELGIVERIRRTILRGYRRVRTSNSYRLIVDTAGQMKAKAAHIGKAVFSRFLLSDRKAEKAKPLFEWIEKDRPQEPVRSREELLSFVRSWAQEEGA